MTSPLRRSLLRFFFYIESLLFIWTYLFGIQGIHVIIKTKKENKLLEMEIESLQKDISDLELKIFKWNTNPFFKEKYARQQLQMTRKDDTVYFI